MLEDEILRLLACPVCKVDVDLVEDRIVCPDCGRKFPVRGGIPVMLVEEAEGPAEAPSGQDEE